MATFVRSFLRAKLDGSTCPVFVQVDQVMDGNPEDASRVTPFTELIPYYPLERIYLETDEKAEWDNVAMRRCRFGFSCRFWSKGIDRGATAER